MKLFFKGLTGKIKNYKSVASAFHFHFYSFHLPMILKDLETTAKAGV